MVQGSNLFRVFKYHIISIAVVVGVGSMHLLNLLEEAKTVTSRRKTLKPRC